MSVLVAAVGHRRISAATLPLARPRSRSWRLPALATKLGSAFQILEGVQHRAQARRNITGEIRLATTRGVIRDAYGKVLAANRPSYNVYVVPEAIDLKATWPTRRLS